MNEQLYTNANGLRLITGYEGEPRLKARLCEGGAYELGYGVTFDLDGQPFNETSTCTPEYADALFRNALKLFEDGVRKLVTVPLNSNQFSALVAFSYNVGLENLAGSTVLRRVNEGRMDDAAASFGMWVFATNGNGHKQALRGLLRRRYSEAALFMGYDWTVACDNDAIALQREIPATLPGTDRVIYKTPFKDVLAVAQAYPLEAPELVLTTKAEPAQSVAPASAGQPELAPQPKAPAAPAPVSKPAAPVSGPAAGPVAAPKAPQAPTPLPVPASKPVDTKSPEKPVVIAPQPVNPNALPTNADTAKNMADSTRMVGMVLVAIGSVIQVVTLRLGIGTAIGAVFFDLTRDPVVITLTVTAIVGALGWLTKKNGKKTFAKGADQAQGNLY